MVPRTADAADPHFPYAGLPVGIYARASDDAKKTKSSVTDQETAGLRWIRQQRASHYRTYCDNDLSGSRFAKKERDDFKEMLADVHTDGLRLLWFWKLSRSQRQLQVFAKLRDLCRRKGVLWVVENRVYNLADRGDRIQLGFQALIDEDLPDQISENVRAGLASSAERGRPHGFTAYGWRRIYDENTGLLVAQEVRKDQAAVVREIAHRLIAGESLYAIAKALNAAGHPAPWGGKWHYSSMGRLLLRASNIGKRSYHDVIVSDAIWPPILDEDTYYECKRILSNPDRQIQHSMAIKYLLSGIARCGVCESKMRCTLRNGRMYYICGQPSRCVTIRMDWLDDYIQALVWARLSRRDAIELLAQPSQAAEVVAAGDEVETLTRRMEEWYAAGRRGAANPIVVSNMVTQLMADIETAKEKAAVQRVSPVLRESARVDIAEIWPGYPLQRQRAIISELLEIQVMPVGAGRGRVFDPVRVPTTWRHELD